MATETSIQAVKTRIERLVGEIASLAKSDLSTSEFFQRYIERVVAACDAKGGAIWIVNAAESGHPEFRLAAQTEFESSGFRETESQRNAILKILSDTISGKRPVVFSPEAAGESAPLNGIRNNTPYPFLHIPIGMKDQVSGVLQVWLQPYVQPANYSEFVTFLIQLAAYVEQHLQSRQLGGLMLETQRLQHLLRFSSDLTGTLSALEVGRLTANYGRDLVGCERCSVLLCEGDMWRVLAISGQEVVEKKSALVKAMAAFVNLHVEESTVVLSRSRLLPNAQETQPQGSTELAPGPDPVDVEFLEASHVASALIVPLFDAAKERVGAILFESGVVNFFELAASQKEAPLANRVADWIGSHSGKAIGAAEEYGSLPLLTVSKSIRAVQKGLRANRRRRTVMRAGSMLLLFLLVALWPVMVKVDGDCVLMPTNRRAIVSEIPARLDRVLVREGDFVKAGQVIAVLDTRRLETELAASRQSRQRYLAEADRYRAEPLLDEASAQVATLQARTEEENAKRLEADIEAGKLRAPFDGVILTKGLELRAGEFLQPGSLFAEIASMNSWEVQLAVEEHDIALIEESLKKEGGLNVRYILYAHSGSKLQTRLSTEQQISASAHAKLKQNLFVITLRDLQFPDAIRDSLRPGLTGRGSVEIHRRPFAWKSIHSVARWFHLKFLT